MKALSPAQTLLFLVLGATTVAGWAYGVHWKRVASGDLFTSDEKMMIRLQEQISTLTKENESLHTQIRELGGTHAGEKPSNRAESVTSQAIPAPSSQSGPALPAPPQKIETH